VKHVSQGRGTRLVCLDVHDLFDRSLLGTPRMVGKGLTASLTKKTNWDKDNAKSIHRLRQSPPHCPTRVELLPTYVKAPRLGVHTSILVPQRFFNGLLGLKASIGAGSNWLGRRCYRWWYVCFHGWFPRCYKGRWSFEKLLVATPCSVGTETMGIDGDVMLRGGCQHS
jgi:hypothetical protein